MSETDTAGLVAFAAAVQPDEAVQDMRLYVEGRRTPSRTIARLFIRIPQSNRKVVLVGPRGCGKSTELRHIAQLVAEQGTMIVETIDLDASGVHAGSVAAMDLLYMCGIALLRRLPKSEGKPLFKALKEAYAGEASSTLGKVEDALNGLAGFGGALAVAAGDAGVTAKVAGGVARTVAQGLRLLPYGDRSVSESSPPGQRMLGAVRTIARAARGAPGRHLLLVIDGLEKMNGQASRRFHAVFESTRLLLEVEWSMVIAAPPSTLTHSDGLAALGFQAYTVWGFPDEPDRLRELVERRLKSVGLRVDEALSGDDIERMVAACAGQPRHLMAICQGAALEAILDDRSAITSADVTRGIRKFAEELARGLDADDKDVLRTVREHPDLPRRDSSAPLFGTGRILAIPPADDDPDPSIRYRVHPLLEPVLRSR